MVLRTVPPEVTGRGTETYISCQFTCSQSHSHRFKLTEGDGKVEDKASAEHLHGSHVSKLDSRFGRWFGCRGRAGDCAMGSEGSIGRERTPVMGLTGIVNVVGLGLYCGVERLRLQFKALIGMQHA
jgi:hypothetical protein